MPSSATGSTGSRRGCSDLGVGKGDVVAFQLPNWWEFTALFFACNRIGAVANPLMPIFRQRELRFMLGFSEAKVAVVPALWRGFDHMGDMREIRPDLPSVRHVFAVGGAGEASFEKTFLDRAPLSGAEKQRLAKSRPGPNEVVQLIYTSGTSGEPKAVMHTANTVLAPAQCFIDDMGLTSRDILFMGSPYAHQTGFLYGMLMPVMLATTTVALDAVVGRRCGAADRARGRHVEHGARRRSCPTWSTCPRSRARGSAARCAPGRARARRSRACWCSGPKPR